MSYQLYRNTTLGNSLQESLDELIQVKSQFPFLLCGVKIIICVASWWENSSFDSHVSSENAAMIATCAIKSVFLFKSSSVSPHLVLETDMFHFLKARGLCDQNLPVTPQDLWLIMHGVLRQWIHLFIRICHKLTFVSVVCIRICYSRTTRFEMPLCRTLEWTREVC